MAKTQIISNATINDLIGLAGEQNRLAKECYMAGFTAGSARHESQAAEYQQLVTIAGLLNADGRFADAYVGALNRQAKQQAERGPLWMTQAEVKALAAPLPTEVTPRVCSRCGKPATHFHGNELWCQPCYRYETTPPDPADDPAWRVLIDAGYDSGVPSHLQPDSSWDLAAEDEYIAAGTGPLAGYDTEA